MRRRREDETPGGLPDVPPYGSDSSISPASEFQNLLSMTRKAREHFQAILNAPPFAPGAKAAGETVAFWNSTNVQKHNTLQLGTRSAQKSADSWQLVECVYYPSDTYFMALNLFQFWPLDDGTLVWQVGFVSAPFRTYLGGVDRYVAGKLMTDETLETINEFRTAVEKQR